MIRQPLSHCFFTFQIYLILCNKPKRQELQPQINHFFIYTMQCCFIILPINSPPTILQRKRKNSLIILLFPTSLWFMAIRSLSVISSPTPTLGHGLNNRARNNRLVVMCASNPVSLGLQIKSYDHNKIKVS